MFNVTIIDTRVMTGLVITLQVYLLQHLRPSATTTQDKLHMASVILYIIDMYLQLALAHAPNSQVKNA